MSHCVLLISHTRHSDTCTVTVWITLRFFILPFCCSVVRFLCDSHCVFFISRFRNLDVTRIAYNYFFNLRSRRSDVRFLLDSQYVFFKFEFLPSDLRFPCDLHCVLLFFILRSRLSDVRFLCDSHYVVFLYGRYLVSQPIYNQVIDYFTGLSYDT